MKVLKRLFQEKSSKVFAKGSRDSEELRNKTAKSCFCDSEEEILETHVSEASLFEIASLLRLLKFKELKIKNWFKMSV